MKNINHVTFVISQSYTGHYRVTFDYYSIKLQQGDKTAADKQYIMIRPETAAEYKEESKCPKQ